MAIKPLARERRHTLHFLAGIRAISPVFLDTEVDMSRVVAYRAAARRDSHAYSFVTFVIYVVGRVLLAHPDANAAVRGRLWPRVSRYSFVHAKLTMDKTMNGQRLVFSAVVRGADRASLDDIQRVIEHYREGDPARMPEFAGARLLHRLPIPLGRVLFRVGMRSLGRRPDLMGTVAIATLGDRPVDGFHSTGGTTITVAAGRVADRPVVRDGQVTVAPIMRLSLTFDHRVIDGAEAADVLNDIKTGLEKFTPERAARATASPDAREDRVSGSY